MRPECDGARRSISSQISAIDPKPRSPPPSREASSAAIIQSGQHSTGGVSFCPTRRHPALDVGRRPRPLVVRRGRQDDVRHASTESLTGRSPRRRRTPPPRAPSLRGRASGKSPSGSAPSEDHGLHRSVRQSLEHPVVSRPRSTERRTIRALRPYQSFADSSETLPGRTPGARPMSSAPMTLPRRSAGRNFAAGIGLGERPALPRAANDCGLSHGAPSENDDEPGAAVARLVRARRSPRRQTSTGADVRRPRCVAASDTVRVPPPQRRRAIVGSVAVANELSVRLLRRDLDDREPVLLGRRTQAQVEDRQLLVQVAGEHHDTHSPSRSRRSSLSAARARAPPASPSPSCASTESVPITPFASFAHA